MAAEALAAEAVASRLERQEEDIRWLWAEVQRLRDEQLNAPDRGPDEGPRLTREVALLRAENRDLRHHLYRLRLCLAEGLSHQAELPSAARAAAAQEGAGRAAASAQVPGRRDSLRGMRGGASQSPGCAPRRGGAHEAVLHPGGAEAGAGGACGVCPPRPGPCSICPSRSPARWGARDAPGRPETPAFPAIACLM